MEWIIFLPSHPPPLPCELQGQYAPFHPSENRNELLLATQKERFFYPIPQLKPQMRPSKEPKRRTRQPSSGLDPNTSGSRSPRLTRSVSVIDRQPVTEDTVATLFEEIEISSGYVAPNPNPRSFPYIVKQHCWDKAEKIKGRDPDRWRRDFVGNIVFRKLVGCAGCLCHDYDHILPYSKGGQSTLENCQVLQARVNRSKGNQTDISKAELIRKSSYCRVSGRDMDLLELSAYGNVHRDKESGGCRIQ